jgi:hypothetical protein
MQHRFLNRVSQVRFLPGALSGVVFRGCWSFRRHRARGRPASSGPRPASSTDVRAARTGAT